MSYKAKVFVIRQVIKQLDSANNIADQLKIILEKTEYNKDVLDLVQNVVEELQKISKSSEEIIEKVSGDELK